MAPLHGGSHETAFATGGSPAGAIPAMRSLAAVEVRKNAEATTWYDAELRDVIGRRAVLSFPDGVWPTREVPCDAVRPVQPAWEPPPGEDPCDAVLELIEIGELLEFRVSASPRNPPGWALGRLLAVEAAGVLRVSIGSGMPTGASRTLLLTPAMVRPVSTETVLDPLSLSRQVVWVDPLLRSWLATPDARGCCELVQSVAGLALVGAGSGARGIGLTAACEPGAGGGNDDQQEQFDALILLGEESACRRGEMLLRIHMMHQREVEAFHDRRRRKLKQLHEQLQLPESVEQVCFDVPSDLVGRMVGKGGERAKRVEEEHGVEIRVVDPRSEGHPCLVRILGDDRDALERAREELELLRQEYPVDEERVGWVLGKGKRNIQDIAKTTGLVFATWTGSALELCGSRKSVEDAVLLLDNHNDYYDVYQEMSRQNEEIERAFDALEIAAESVGLSERNQRKGRSKDPQGRRKGDDAQAESSARPRARSRARNGDSGGGRGRGAKGAAGLVAE